MFLVNEKQLNLTQASKANKVEPCKPTHAHIETIHKELKACFYLQDALSAFPGLYHYDYVKKQNKVLFITKPGNTYKTTILTTLFQQLIGLQQIDIISRQTQRFNLANLRKKDEKPYFLIINDFRWLDFGI